METIALKEPLFSFSKLEPLIDNTLKTPVREKELSTTLPTPSISHPAENDSDLFSAHFSDDNSPPAPQRSTKICHKPIQYGLIAHHIAFSFIAQSEIYELLSYNKAMQFL